MSANDSNKPGGYLPWVMWGIPVFFYFFEQILQVSPNVMTNQLMDAFQIGSARLGRFAGAYFIAYAAMQLPVGLLLDKIGPRKAIGSAAAICAIGCVLFGMTDSYHRAVLARIFIGVGSAFASIGTFKVVANWFPTNRFAFLLGSSVTIAMIGGIVGEAPLSLLLDAMDWRMVMNFLGGFSAFLAVLTFLVLRDHPKGAVIKEAHIDIDIAGLMRGLKTVLLHPQSWCVAAYGGLMYTPTMVLGTLWGTPFLVAVYGIDTPTASLLISMLFAGWIVGSPLFGAMSDYIGRRKRPMYIGTIGALMCLHLVIYIKMPLILLGSSLFLLGFFSGGFLPSFSIIREIHPQRTNATALGFMNTINMTGPAVLLPLFGYVLHARWDGTTLAGGTPVYSLSAYHDAMVILPGCMFIALILLPFIRETFCRTAD